MEEKITPNEAIDEIRKMMDRSTRSYLGGWAPLLCGLVALAGGLTVNALLKAPDEIDGGPSAMFVFGGIALTVLLTLTLGIAIPFVISIIRAKKDGISLTFNDKNRRQFVTLFLPVAMGGIICYSLLYVGAFTWMPAVMLCLYGLAVFNLSRYNEPTMVWPGLAFIIIGLAACFLREYSLLLWIIGFGGVHIAYGIFLLVRNRG